MVKNRMHMLLWMNLKKCIGYTMKMFKHSKW